MHKVRFDGVVDIFFFFTILILFLDNILFNKLCQYVSIEGYQLSAADVN
jgi:hypothetical protein